MSSNTPPIEEILGSENRELSNFPALRLSTNNRELEQLIQLISWIPLNRGSCHFEYIVRVFDLLILPAYDNSHLMRFYI